MGKNRARKDFLTWLREGLGWRWDSARRRIGRAIRGREQHWCRVVMDRETAKLIGELDVATKDCLEISGTKWRTTGFQSYRTADYPEYDVCARPFEREAFDVVIAEQVLEHVLWPYRAVRHVFDSLRPGGVFLVTTPFLLRVHKVPVDCSRWTELGLKHLFAEGGFELDTVRTGSWGNRACVKSNFRQWTKWLSWFHSLRNEPDFPVVVWALARKPG
jgi:SAM-dependent methyltransferase